MVEHWRKGSGEEPVVLLCRRERCGANTQYGPLIRDIFIVECCTGGYGSVVVNGREFPVKGGDCYILLPGDTVKHTAGEQPRRGMWCAVDGLAVGRYLKRAGITSETPFAPPEAFDLIRGWMERLLELQERADAGTPLEQTACIYGVLGALLRCRNTLSGEDLTEKAIGLMQTNYYQLLSVTDVARHVGLTRAYFSALFKEKTGRSPYQYLTDLRLSKACRLLEEAPEHSVAGIAELVGLDPRSFARLFRREMGKTPLEYRTDCRTGQKPALVKRIEKKQERE